MHHDYVSQFQPKHVAVRIFHKTSVLCDRFNAHRTNCDLLTPSGMCHLKSLTWLHSRSAYRPLHNLLDFVLSSQVHVLAWLYLSAIYFPFKPATNPRDWV